MRFPILFPLCLLIVLIGAREGIAAGPTNERPNVLLIITDDQGYGDFGAHGNQAINTPNLDKLHKESVRFIDFHVDPTCSPTRGVLMSGKYSHRAKVWHTIAAGNHLRAGEMTMAEVFKATGYRTGLFGKWHLGSNYPFRPMDQGFDEWLGQGDGGTGTTDDYFNNDRVNDYYLHNGEPILLPGFAPDNFFDAAINFIQQDQDDEQPFFVYLSTYVPHSPHTLPNQAWPKKYESTLTKPEAYFFASIERVDQRIGLLRQTLEDEGLAENTLVIFMTDNGGTGGVNYFNAGMRGRKGSVYEGGHRVPLFLHWPAGKLSHGTDVEDLTAHFDILPTLIDLCNLQAPRQVDFDGRSFKKQLFQPTLQLPERTLFVETQRTFIPNKWENTAAMTKQWRLIDNSELYDIKNDPGQSRNVLSDHPEVVNKLRQKFENYWNRVTPGDRDRVVFVVGHESDPETYLHSSDWYEEKVPWSHNMTSRGLAISGSWLISPEKPGLYRFEVRRWPKELEAPIAGVPQINKTVDAWDANGEISFPIYGPQSATYKAHPVTFVRLKVGEYESVQKINVEETYVTFDVKLDQSQYEVTAELLDASQELIAGAYYAYCSKLNR